MELHKLKLQDLNTLNQEHIEKFVDTLQQHGFAILQTDGFTGNPEIRKTLLEAKGMQTFRFPAHDAPIEYTEDKRASFQSLFLWSRICLRALLVALNPEASESQEIQNAIEKSIDEQILFSPNGTGHTPFPEGVGFSSSFYNIFHYDYGLLNHHKDRYLVTVVAVNSERDCSTDNTDSPKTALWAQSPSAGWVNIDALLEDNEIAIFTGEDFEALSTRLGNPIPAVLHCTRVDPTGPRLPRYDNQPDPSTPPTGNRVSMAFVLSDASDD